MTWGAIRNAQLMKVYLPEWCLRVYIPLTSDSPSTETSTSLSLNTSEQWTSLSVEQRVVVTLKRLGAQVIPVLVSFGQFGLASLRAVLADQDVGYVLMRRPSWRLGAREAAAVLDWVNAAESGGPDSAVVHCIHDTFEHARVALVDELWGFRPRALERRLLANNVDMDDGGGFLNRRVWPVVADAAYCHNSVETCFDGPLANITKQFSVERQPDEGFVGLSYNENQEPTNPTNAVPAQQKSC